MRAPLAAPFIALVCVSAVAPAQVDTVPHYRGRVLGVFDEQSGEPVEGVRVLDVLNGNSALTTRTGTVTLAFLPDGGSLVRLQKIGYGTQTLAMKISPADTEPLTVLLARATQLPAVVTRDSAPRYISPMLRGFQERMKTESGYYIDEATLRKNENRTLANLLSTKPGVIVYYGKSNASYLMKSPRCSNGGPPQIYLDGVAISPTPEPLPPRQKPAAAAGGADPLGEQATHPFNLSEFNISDLAGVEWYPDTEIVPIEFGHTTNRCGALLLWTRER